MEFQHIPVSKVDREFRELEKRTREELFAFFGISMRDYSRVILENADKRIRAARALQASATQGADRAFGKE